MRTHPSFQNLEPPGGAFFEARSLYSLNGSSSYHIRSRSPSLSCGPAACSSVVDPSTSFGGGGGVLFATPRGGGGGRSTLGVN